MRFNLFESSVISYGSKAKSVDDMDTSVFESSVISYGSKARGGFGNSEY